MHIDQILCSGAFQPAAAVLVGDPNMTKEEGETAIQKLQPSDSNFMDSWHGHETLFRCGGDILFVKGTNATVFDIPIGASYTDRGMRHDQHDAFGVELVILATTVPPAKRRKLSGDVSQPSGTSSAGQTIVEAERKSRSPSALVDSASEEPHFQCRRRC